jgi:hypothetical protein
MRGGNTAISFSRDIPAQICNVFFVSSVLAQHVYEVTKRPPRDDKDRRYNDANLARVLKQISIMPMTFFPDEVSKPVPFIKYHEEGNGGVRVLIEMPAKRARPSGIPWAQLFLQAGE